ncbi:hypothetical protein SAMD00023353_5600630 [Rosellinia necatrix]|uniref:Uncharacterized protein n=1 Tax=Rosellinia necatrix TaxID=77044 RepID=A0A1S8A9Z4_ROSNE|nr:hypothetical protein SAMD00023353_5600630 [Rosellinia necatrix]
MTGKQESKYWNSEDGRKHLASNRFIAKDAMGGKLVRAPVGFSRPARILDSGTADGTWLLDFASPLPPPLPSAGTHEFVGADPNPAFPRSNLKSKVTVLMITQARLPGRWVIVPIAKNVPPLECDAESSRILLTRARRCPKRSGSSPLRRKFQ